MDKISIIVPTLNSREHLNRIIMGLLKQTYTNLEIIIIDSGSSDDTIGLSYNWSFFDERIKVYQTKNSIFDFGFSVSTGKYILFIDCINLDDNLMIEKMINALINDNSDISVYNSNCNHINNYLVYDNMKILNSFNGCLWNKLFKRSLFDDYSSIKDLFNLALRKAVRISLFV